MACNCKNKMKLVNSKYGDGNDNKNETILSEIFNFIIRFIFGILCGIIIIVVLIPMLIYIILCIMIGKQPSFKIKKFEKYLDFERMNKKLRSL